MPPGGPDGGRPPGLSPRDSDSCYSVACLMLVRGCAHGVGFCSVACCVTLLFKLSSCMFVFVLVVVAYVGAIFFVNVGMTLDSIASCSEHYYCWNCLFSLQHVSVDGLNLCIWCCCCFCCSSSLRCHCRSCILFFRKRLRSQGSIFKLSRESERWYPV